MNVTDSRRASSAAGLLVAGTAASLGLMALFYAVIWLALGSYGDVLQWIHQSLGIAVAVLMAGALFQLSGAVSGGTVLRLAAVVMIVDAIMDVVVRLYLPSVVPLDHGMGITLVHDVSTLLSLTSRILLVVALVQLTMKTHAWVMPLLGLVVVNTVMRFGMVMAKAHHLGDLEFYRNQVFQVVMPMLSLFNGLVLLGSALAVKAAVVSGPNVTTPALVAAAGLRPSGAQPIGPLVDLLIGGILLAVGIGVTAVTWAVASNGGRFLAICTVAIGLGRIIRGGIKLARNGVSSKLPQTGHRSK